MSAPTPTARQTPAGIKVKDGFPATITFAADPDVSFWEKTVKPPGIDGGDPIPQTTMLNSAWHTMAPRSLKKLTECSGSAAYDPNVVNNILALINVETTVTVRWADGSTLAFFGYLQKVEFEELKEGEQPSLNYTVQPTNFDPVAHTEQPPVLTSVVGT